MVQASRHGITKRGQRYEQTYCYIFRVVDGLPTEASNIATRRWSHGCSTVRSLAGRRGRRHPRTGRVFGAVSGSPPLFVPTPFEVDGDCCGAGDRFAASMALGLARGASTAAAVGEVAGWPRDGGVAPRRPASAGQGGPGVTGERHVHRVA